MAQRQCDNKKRHHDKESADRTVALLGRANASFRSYECPYCGYWHIGHVIPPVAALPGDSPDKCAE